jgi:pimeloyl-ACP methyl ester carboxylesterase
MDLPISEPAAGLADYADAITIAMDGLSDPVVVGHSMAGLVIPLVAERRRVSKLIFLAAFLPVPGESLGEQREREPIDGTVPPKTAEWTDLGENVWMVGPNTAIELFYPDARPGDAAWAVSQLRPQGYKFMSEPSSLSAWPDVPSRFIVCHDDVAINPHWCRAAARDRLGTEAVEIAGAHSPFVTRPAELAELLATML